MKTVMKESIVTIRMNSGLGPEFISSPHPPCLVVASVLGESISILYSLYIISIAYTLFEVI